jgi:glycosyltransferase involved in cell wall biosynthesis
LYAGRLSPEKGIYTFLESLHHPIAEHKPLIEQGYKFTVVTAGNQTIHGSVIEKFLRHHPWIDLIKAKQNPGEMADLYAEHEIVVVPSNDQYWHEAFGMNSVEAQHSGCRVVASNGGGLPETNCGELILYEPDNSFALYQAIRKAGKLGPLTAAGRKEATKHFSLKESVDSLLTIIGNK